MELVEEIERKNVIRIANQPATYVKQRIAEAAKGLSLAGSAQVRCELVNESLCKLTTVLYEQDGDGTLANVEVVTERILIPVPWGSSGWKLWGLRYWEARTLAKILRVRVENRRKLPVLFDYSAESRNWYINVDTYPTVDAALVYLQKHPVSLHEWKTYSQAYKEYRREVVTAHRNK